MQFHKTNMGRQTKDDFTSIHDLQVGPRESSDNEGSPTELKTLPVEVFCELKVTELASV